MDLFEQVLKEADKSRFIKPIWAALENTRDARESIMNDVASKINEMKEESQLPYLDDVLKFVNSGAADKYKIDWNKFTFKGDSPEDEKDKWWNEAVKLISSYIDYNKTKELKKDQKEQFKDEKKFKILYETDNWLFVGVLSYEAAVYCDSFKCGGAGAKWCIGWERSDQYWMNYTFTDRDRFVLAYNKKTYGDLENQKYMIQIENGCGTRACTWPQNDDPDETLSTYPTLSFFKLPEGILEDWYTELKASIQNLYDETFALSQSQQHNIEVYCSDSSLYLSSDRQFPMSGFEFYKMIKYVHFESGNRVKELVYDGNRLNDELVSYHTFNMLPTEITTRVVLDPKIVFMNLKSILMYNLFISSASTDLSFLNCENIVIDTVYIPVPRAYEEEYLDAINSGKSPIEILKECECALSFENCPNVKIEHIRLLPSRLGKTRRYDTTRDSYGIYVSLDDLDEKTGKIEVDCVKGQIAGRIMFDLLYNPTVSIQNSWRWAIDEENKKILLNKIFKFNGDSPSRLFTYNCPVGYEAVWEDSNGPKPDRLYTFPGYNIPYEESLV